MSGPLYKEGYRFGTGNDEVIIRKVYPPGHKYASEDSYWYLVYSYDYGEDCISEYSVTEQKKEAEAKGWQELDNFMDEQIQQLSKLQKKEIKRTAKKIMIEIIREALGWETGSIHECANEIRRLKKRDAMITQYDEGILGSMKKITFVKSNTVSKGEAVMLINPENCRFAVKQPEEQPYCKDGDHDWYLVSNSAVMAEFCKNCPASRDL